MDGTVIAFFAAVCLGTGIIFGLAPALHASKTDVNEMLKEGGRSGTAGVRARRWTGALDGRRARADRRAARGRRLHDAQLRDDVPARSRHRHVEAADDGAGAAGSQVPALEQRLAFYERLEERLKSNPKIESVTITSNIAAAGRLPAQARRSTASRSTRGSRRRT